MTKGALRHPRSEDDDTLLLLAARRREILRLAPPRPLVSSTEAMRFIRDRKIVMTTGRSSLAMMTQAIAGKEIHGSWMADPSCHAVHDMLTGILAQDDVHQVPLVEGKSVLFTSALGAAIQRVASDPERRSAARSALSQSALRLLETVESAGEVWMDRLALPTKEGRADRLVLERELLVKGESIHTERGRHTAVLRPWARSEIARKFSAGADKLGRDQAQAALLEAGLHSAIVAPEKEVLNWLPSASQLVGRLIGTGRMTRLCADKNWLTLTTTLRQFGQ